MFLCLSTGNYQLKHPFLSVMQCQKPLPIVILLFSSSHPHITTDILYFKYNNILLLLINNTTFVQRFDTPPRNPTSSSTVYTSPSFPARLIVFQLLPALLALSARLKLDPICSYQTGECERARLKQLQRQLSNQCTIGEDYCVRIVFCQKMAQNCQL